MCALLLVPTSASAHYNRAYLRSADEFRFNNTDWMSQIDEEKRLSDISIPGTHDTMSIGYGGDIAQTQGLTLQSQLAKGIRFIDIRVRAYDNAFSIHHGPIYLHKNFDDVLNTCIQFLREHPGETIYMRLKQEYSSVDNAELNRILMNYLNKTEFNKYLYKGNSSNPRLKTTRGKFVLFKDFRQSVAPGLEYPYDFDIQDKYSLSTNWDLYSKWLSVKNQLVKADTSSRNSIFINYLSGSGGSFPYFVASGHSSPGTGAPRLLTGLTVPGWAGAYPDFPRVNWVGSVASIAFEGTNILTNDFIKKDKLQRTGIVVADFPGESLINTIIGLNNNFTAQKELIDGEYQIKVSHDRSKVIDVENKTNRQVLIWKNHGGGNQRWTFKYHSKKDAYQIFTNNGTNEVLTWDKQGGSKRVVCAPNENDTTSYWKIEQTKDELYVIRNYSNLDWVLDVDNYYPVQGTHIKMNEYHGANSPQVAAQVFEIVRS